MDHPVQFPFTQLFSKIIMNPVSLGSRSHEMWRCCVTRSARNIKKICVAIFLRASAICGALPTYFSIFQILIQENAELQAGISLAQTQLETALAAQETQKRVIDTLNAQLASRIQELVSIHKEIAMALQTWGHRQPEWLWTCSRCTTVYVKLYTITILLDVTIIFNISTSGTSAVLILS